MCVMSSVCQCQAPGPPSDPTFQLPAEIIPIPRELARGAQAANTAHLMPSKAPGQAAQAGKDPLPQGGGDEHQESCIVCSWVIWGWFSNKQSAAACSRMREQSEPPSFSCSASRRISAGTREC